MKKSRKRDEEFGPTIAEIQREQLRKRARAIRERVLKGDHDAIRDAILFSLEWPCDGV